MIADTLGARVEAVKMVGVRRINGEGRMASYVMDPVSGIVETLGAQIALPPLIGWCAFHAGKAWQKLALFAVLAVVAPLAAYWGGNWSGARAPADWLVISSDLGVRRTCEAPSTPAAGRCGPLALRRRGAAGGPACWPCQTAGRSAAAPA